MLFLPYSTDAPIYHYPIATAGIIAANVAIFFATSFQAFLGNLEIDQIEWLILQFNQINPLQWITNNFMHAGIMHLLSNMFFLWAFGLVVEGKIGSLKFLGLYMAMGAAYGALVQIPMFFISGDGGALGASGVIFAVIMIALLWAPENDVECFYWVFVVFGTAEIKIVKLAVTFLFIQILFLWLGGFSMSSEMLHMAGAAIGAPVGLWMLRGQHVDCEDWDLISRNKWLQNYDVFCSEKRRRQLQQKEDGLHDPVSAALQTSGSTTASPSAQLAARAGTIAARSRKTEPNSDRKKTNAKRSVFGKGKSDANRRGAGPSSSSAAHPEFNRLSMLLRQAIESRSQLMAQQHYEKLDQLGIADGLSDSILFAYVKVLAEAKQWMAAIGPLRLVIKRDGVSANDALLRVAHIQLNVMRKPIDAAATLQQIKFDTDTLSESQRRQQQLRDAMMAKCSE